MSERIVRFRTIKECILDHEAEVASRARDRERALKRVPRVRYGSRPAAALALLRAQPAGSWLHQHEAAGRLGWTRAACGYVLRCLETQGLAERDAAGCWRAKGAT